MSTDHTVYAVLGVTIRDKDKMNYIRSVIDQGDPDRFQKPHTDFDVIIDGMCGEYIVIGEVLASFDSYGGGNFTEVSMGYVASMKDDLEIMINEAFPNLWIPPIQFFMFSHFS